jgi:hypothetical protein
VAINGNSRNSAHVEGERYFDYLEDGNRISQQGDGPYLPEKFLVQITVLVS